MPRTRVTISLDTDSPSDRAVLEFLLGLPRRTRSEIVKEILLDALDRRDCHKDSPPTKPDDASVSQASEIDDVIAKFF